VGSIPAEGTIQSTYHTKYEQNLKREFPRLPFSADFQL
jgi:hypothetical protein